MKIKLLLAFLLILPICSMAQSDADCITSKCHATIGTEKFVHGPVGAKICSICHVPVEGKQHKFTLAAEKEQLCFNCHENSRDMMLEEHLHTPVADGDCTGCHDPHQTNYRYSLKGEGAELCYVCHEKAKFMKEFQHGPIGVGDCNACHNPHASANEEQLIAPKKELCFMCHKEQSNMLNERHIHSPVAENCANCHDPHSNDAKFLLAADTPNLCYNCHADFADFANVEYKHEPVAAGRCADCHEVHSSEFPRLFPKAQEDLCFSCHEELATFVNAQQYKHGPVKEGDCNACHAPHGSNYVSNLRKFFPPEFYMPYETDNYAICFDCHNKNFALEKNTTATTDFRDGDVNMHYLHVNKEVKGRSCKACHQVHASSQQKHIRESVPFGTISWELPVTFTKYEDGGKCVVGCHSPKEYHRK